MKEKTTKFRHFLICGYLKNSFKVANSHRIGSTKYLKKLHKMGEKTKDFGDWSHDGSMNKKYSKKIFSNYFIRF